MDVKSAGRAALFAQIIPCTFFRVIRDPPLFGLCVTEGNQIGAVMFDQVHPPRLAIGGLPTDPLMVFQNTQMRAPIEAAVSTMNSVPSLGELIDSDDQFFMRAPAPGGGQLAAISYGAWEVGQIVDDTFTPIYSHPPEGIR